MEVDRRLRVHRGQHVDRELGDDGDEQEWRKQRQERERPQQLQRVVQVAAGESRVDQAGGMRERGLDDPSGRTADLAVARIEVRRLAVVEVRDDDGRGDRGPRDAERDNRSALDPAPSRHAVPHTEAGEHEGNLLFARGGCDREERERQQAVLVQEPEGEQEERRRQRDRMELVQRQPAGRRVEEIRAREPERRAGRAEVLPREPEDRQRAEPERERLRRE